MAILPRRRDLFGAGGGYESAGIDLQTLRPGEYYAEAGNNQMSNIPGLDLPPVGANVRAGFDANAALKAGRMFRTRAQEQDLQRMAKAQDRLQSQRSRMDKLAMTQEGRKRAEAAEAAPAEREARLLAKHQRDLQQIRAAKVEPAEVKARSVAEQAQSNATQKEADRTQKGELTREGFTVTKDVAKQQSESRKTIAEENRKFAMEKQLAELVFKREELRSKENIAKAQMDAASKLAEDTGKKPGTQPYKDLMQGEIDKMVAVARAKGDTDSELAVLRQAQALQRQRFGGQVDIAKQMLDPTAIPAAPAAVGPAAAAQPAAAGADANQNSIPDNLESFIGKLAQLEKSANPVDQDKALRARQKMIRSGVSEDAVTRAIKAYNAAQNAKAK